MKATLLLFVVLGLVPLAAEDWRTVDGTTYEDVKVIKVDDDAITILFKDGGALVPIAKLPSTLQKRFSYDPVKAKVRADARAKEDAENSKQLQAEMELARQMKLQQQIKYADQMTNRAPTTP